MPDETLSAQEALRLLGGTAIEKFVHLSPINAADRGDGTLVVSFPDLALWLIQGSAAAEEQDAPSVCAAFYHLAESLINAQKSYLMGAQV